MMYGCGELEMTDMGSQNVKGQGDDETDGNDVSRSAWNDAGEMRMAKAMTNEELRDRAVDEVEMAVVAVTTPQWVVIQHLLPNRGGARSFSRVDSEIKEIL